MLNDALSVACAVVTVVVPDVEGASPFTEVELKDASMQVAEGALTMQQFTCGLDGELERSSRVADSSSLQPGAVVEGCEHVGWLKSCDVEDIGIWGRVVAFGAGVGRVGVLGSLDSGRTQCIGETGTFKEVPGHR